MYVARSGHAAEAAARSLARWELAAPFDEMSAAVIEALESPLFELADGESVHPEILERAQNLLDLEESRLAQLENGGRTE